MIGTDWLVVNFSLEEKLVIERRARSVISHDDGVEVAKLCAQLIRQTAFQERLLAQATGHIAYLEAQVHIMQSRHARRRPWWKIL
jgi:hypothetical protein